MKPNKRLKVVVGNWLMQTTATKATQLASGIVGRFG
jgi:hypothetical protein